MSIIIKVEKIVLDDNNKYFKVIGLEALKSNDLPEAYTNRSTKNIYLSYNEDSFYTSFKDMGRILSIGSFYHKEDFYKKLEFIKEAGKNLARIKKEIKEKKKSWKGEFAFVI
jgi:hypothetical protein